MQTRSWKALFSALSLISELGALSWCRSSTSKILRAYLPLSITKLSTYTLPGRWRWANCSFYSALLPSKPPCQKSHMFKLVKDKGAEKAAEWSPPNPKCVPRSAILNKTMLCCKHPDYIARRFLLEKVTALVPQLMLCDQPFWLFCVCVSSLQFPVSETRPLLLLLLLVVVGFFFSNCSCVQVCVKTAWWGVVSLFQLRFKNGLLFVWTFCNPCGDWTMTNVLSFLFFLNILLGLQLIKPLPPWKPQPTQKCHILSTYVYQLQHNSLYKQIRYKL